MTLRTLVVLTYLLVFPSAASAADSLPGPIPVKVVDVVNGVTFNALAKIWIGVTIERKVVVRGVDAPDLPGKCKDEKAAAAEAKAFLKVLLDTTPVHLLNIAPDRTFGRVVADVRAAGIDVSSTIIGSGFGRPYERGKPWDWCQRD